MCPDRQEIMLAGCKNFRLEALAEGGPAERSVMQALFPRSIWLQRDATGRFLWACFADGVGAASVRSRGYGISIGRKFDGSGGTQLLFPIRRISLAA